MKTGRTAWFEALEGRTLLAAVSWDGGGDGESLADPLNWSTNQVPDGGDDATINIAGEPVIRAVQGVFIFHSLTCFEEVDFGFGGPFSLTLVASSVFKADARISGAIAGAGNVTFQGRTTWDGLTFDVGGRAIVADSAVVQASGSALTLNRRLDNQGLIQLDTPIQQGKEVEFNNFAGGILSWTGQDINGTGPGATFNNLGTIVVTGGNISFGFFGQEHLISSGTILVNAGEFRLNSSQCDIFGGLFLASNAGAVASADADFASSSRIWGNGTLSTLANVTVDGTVDKLGALEVVQGTLTINGPTKVRNLAEFAGELTGTADVFVLRDVQWFQGTMSGAGRTIVTKGATGTMNLESNSGLLRRRFVNNGDLVFTGFLFLDGGVIENNPGSVVHIAVFLPGKAPTMAGKGAGGTLLNKGTVELSQLTDATFTLERLGADMRLTNNGTLDVSTSRAVFEGTVTQVSGTTLTGGTWITGGDLELGANIRTNAANVTLDGEAASFLSLTGLKTNQGSLTVRLGAVLAIVPQGGVFTNTGTLVVGLGAELFITGGFTQTAQGTTTIRISDVGEANFGRIVATGAATLAGKASFEFVNGFVPSAGQKFLFLSSASRTGTFGSVSSVGLPPGLKIALVHFNKGVRMDILNA